MISKHSKQNICYEKENRERTETRMNFICYGKTLMEFLENGCIPFVISQQLASQSSFRSVFFRNTWCPDHANTWCCVVAMLGTFYKTTDYKIMIMCIKCRFFPSKSYQLKTTNRVHDKICRCGR